jgi:hypothetical protein
VADVKQTSPREAAEKAIDLWVIAVGDNHREEMWFLESERVSDRAVFVTPYSIENFALDILGVLCQIAFNQSGEENHVAQERKNKRKPSNNHKRNAEHNFSYSDKLFVVVYCNKHIIPFVGTHTVKCDREE